MRSSSQTMMSNVSGLHSNKSETSRFRRVSYKADSQCSQRERIAKDVSEAELLAPAAISAIVVVHLLR